jgi:hypothetical protein
MSCGKACCGTAGKRKLAEQTYQLNGCSRKGFCGFFEKQSSERWSGQNI